MPVFTYRGVNKTGDTVAGERSAANKAERERSTLRSRARGPCGGSGCMRSCCTTVQKYASVNFFPTP